MRQRYLQPTERSAIHRATRAFVRATLTRVPKSLRATLALALLVPGISLHAQTQEPPATRLLSRAGESRAKGSAEATVLVYEIADFQCPFCARFAIDVFPQIDSAYIRTGKVRWVYVNLPMPSHTYAWLAAEAALCAGAVADRFWVMHDRLYVAGKEWIEAADPGAVIARYAREAGLPMDAYNACVNDDQVAPLILRDVIFGSRVTGTPTFVVNNQQTIVGVKTFAEWQEVLEPLLRKRE